MSPVSPSGDEAPAAAVAPAMDPANPAADPRIAALDAALSTLGEHADPEVRRAAAELFEGLRWLHAEGIERLVDLVSADRERFAQALADPVVGNLLMLHDLVVIDERSRAREALAGRDAELAELGFEARIGGVEDGIVTLHLRGGRAVGEDESDEEAEARLSAEVGQALALIERALVAALPGFQGLRVDTPPPDTPAQPVSVLPPEKLAALTARAEAAELERAGEAVAPPPPRRNFGLGGRGPRLDVAALDDLPETGLHGALIDGFPVLVVRRGGTTRAFRNACPGSILPLHVGRLEDDVLVCLWHGCRFDAATGERLPDTAPEPGSGPASVAAGPLQPLPADERDGRLWVEAR